MLRSSCSTRCAPGLSAVSVRQRTPLSAVYSTKLPSACMSACAPPFPAVSLDQPTPVGPLSTRLPSACNSSLYLPLSDVIDWPVARLDPPASVVMFPLDGGARSSPDRIPGCRPLRPGQTLRTGDHSRFPGRRGAGAAAPAAATAGRAARGGRPGPPAHGDRGQQLDRVGVPTGAARRLVRRAHRAGHLERLLA